MHKYPESIKFTYKNFCQMETILTFVHNIYIYFLKLIVFSTFGNLAVMISVIYQKNIPLVITTDHNILTMYFEM
jgi:hypothetical protein